MELSGAEAFLVPALKFIMILVMAGGAIAVFRELIPMARGAARSAPVETEEQA